MKDSIKSNLTIIRYPPQYPKSVHLYITNECNLGCEKCYYRTSSDPHQQLSLEQMSSLFQEWEKYDLTSIAIGGGEPLLHPEISEIIQLAKEMGFFIAVTTNGTVLKSITPDRIHISYDELHPTWKNEKLIQNAINYYSKLRCKIGINHIVTNLKNIEYIETTFEKVDNILLIREKPKSSFTQWDSIPYQQNYWIEGCREGSICEQGVLSFHYNYNNEASICSNFKESIPYTSLPDIWHKLKQFKCKLRDNNQKRVKKI
ncbi:hypothetical protein LCGC14_0957970 [marine sediment metagenome]|uniref:Radical SAM core domain-containing protein n=1 Tax=marine sediment metagenome TaxID=412755 RepID=A0A0F9QYM0_9ZZZZ|nr:radical SAM protein [archaeon]